MRFNFLTLCSQRLASLTALVAAFRMTANFPQTGLWANLLPSRMRGRLGCFLCAPLQSSDCIIHLGGDADTPLLIGSESSVTPDHSSSSNSSGSMVELFGSIWLLNTEHQQHAHLWPTYSLTLSLGTQECHTDPLHPTK